MCRAPQVSWYREPQLREGGEAGASVKTAVVVYRTENTMPRMEEHSV